MEVTPSEYQPGVEVLVGCKAEKSYNLLFIPLLGFVKLGSGMP
jgi:hypothetical protein